jgi:hypothetical protein
MRRLTVRHIVAGIFLAGMFMAFSTLGGVTTFGHPTTASASGPSSRPELAPETTPPLPATVAFSCCRLAEAQHQAHGYLTSGGGSASGGEDANVAAWVIGLPGGGVQPPNGLSLAECTGWVFATDMPDLVGSTIAGGMRLDPDGILAFLYQRDCGSDGIRQYVWVRQESPESMARAAQENLRISLLPAPVPQLSPATHSVVHLETWLAVHPVAAVSVTADIPGLWLTVTARVISTTFDLDDGVTITCAGTGQIWRHHHQDVAANCGHTFTKFDQPTRNRTLRIWLNWEITWSSSTGQSGALDPVSSAVRRIAHPVREIQTIGIRG